jgi:hypothetical protein
MLSDLFAESVETTLATLSGCPAAERTSGGIVLLSSLHPPHISQRGVALYGFQVN